MTGWCSPTFRPCRSPARICAGTAIAAKITASFNIFRLASTCTPRRRYHALTPPITKQVVRNAASTMCASRYGNDGLKMIAHQSTGRNMPSTISCPCGVCIQLLAARIQNVENSVPSATMQVARKCSFGDTRFQPNSITPRKLASRKNAVSTSYDSSGPRMAPARSLSTAQLVPNWKLMTMPLTTPMPNEIAKILTQKKYRSRHTAARVRSQRHSRNASQCARPMVKAGNRIWNEITNPNWIRDSNSASMTSLPSDDAT